MSVELYLWNTMEVVANGPNSHGWSDREVTRSNLPLADIDLLAYR